MVTEYHTTHTIYNLENCGKNISLPNNIASVFGDYDSATQNQMLPNITGWTHTTNGKTAEWKNTKLSGADYNNPTNGKANSDCNNVDTLNMVLLPKPIIEVASSIICKGKKATITAFGAAFQANYDWSPNTGLSCTSCNPTIAQPITTTNYTTNTSTTTATLTITNARNDRDRQA